MPCCVRVEKMVCPYCQHSKTVRQVFAERFSGIGVLLACAYCKGAYFQRRPSASVDEYWEGDAVNGEVYSRPEVRVGFARKYARYLDLLDQMELPGRSLLEVGCGSGIFLQLASQRGWVAHGLDISAEAIEMAHRFCPSATLHCGPLERADFPPASFDVIALWDVIEHVDDPEALLRRARQLLREPGILILETPDEGCPARHLVRLAYYATGGRVSLLHALYYPAHRWYFSRHAMRLVLQRVGFGGMRFYREQTVREFSRQKLEAYGAFQAWSQRTAIAAASLVGKLPWLRNKMVVVAAVESTLIRRPWLAPFIHPHRSSTYANLRATGQVSRDARLSRTSAATASGASISGTT